MRRTGAPGRDPSPFRQHAFPREGQDPGTGCPWVRWPGSIGQAPSRTQALTAGRQLGRFLSFAPLPGRRKLRVKRSRRGLLLASLRAG